MTLVGVTLACLMSGASANAKKATVNRRVRGEMAGRLNQEGFRKPDGSQFSHRDLLHTAPPGGFQKDALHLLLHSPTKGDVHYVLLGRSSGSFAAYLNELRSKPVPEGAKPIGTATVLPINPGPNVGAHSEAFASLVSRIPQSVLMGGGTITVYHHGGPARGGESFGGALARYLEEIGSTTNVQVVLPGR